MWRQRPRGMLSIAAERQALRRAFPAETSGIGDLDSGEDFSPSPAAPPRTTVAETAAAAKRYRELYDDADQVATNGNGQHVDTTTGEVLDPEDEPAEEPPEPNSRKKNKQPDVTMRSQLGQRFAELVEEAARLEVPFDDLKLEFPAPYELAVRHGEKLRDRIEARKRQLAEPQADESEPTQEALV
jgi:hypothetical protein